MVARETADARKNTVMWVAPFGGSSVRLETEILPLEVDAELPERAEADSDPRVPVTVYRSAPSTQTSTKEPSVSRDSGALTEPNGGRTTWKCSLSVLSFPAAEEMICFPPEEAPSVARNPMPLSNPLVPSCGPVTSPRLQGMAAGGVPANMRRSFTAF